MESKTPNKTSKAPSNSKTPNMTKTPRRAGELHEHFSRLNLTPSRYGDFRGLIEGDRFIAQHDPNHFEYVRHTITNKSDEENVNPLNTSSSAPCSPLKSVRPTMSRVKSAADLVDDTQMLVFRRNGAPRVPGQRVTNVLYTAMAPSSSAVRNKRVYSKAPLEILDLPNLESDFYLNLADWSSNNRIALALNDECYIFDASEAKASLLFNVNTNRQPQDMSQITGIRFSQDGHFLACGLSNDRVQIYNVVKQVKVRSYQIGERSRVAALAWNSTGLLAFGDRSGTIQIHDVRQNRSFVAEKKNHNSEVCGLNFMYDKFLVSGGADANVCVYNAQHMSSPDNDFTYCFEEHLSTVKAMAEVPFMDGPVIATGGGTNDGTVKFWDLSTGELMSSFETGNQVSALAFDKHYKEMVTSHGHPYKGLKVWKYKQSAETFAPVHEIPSDCRVLSMTKSPCGQYIGVIADNESLAIYDIFKKDEKVLKLLQTKSKLNIGLSGMTSFNQRLR